LYSLLCRRGAGALLTVLVLQQERSAGEEQERRGAGEERLYIYVLSERLGGGCLEQERSGRRAVAYAVV
jgi:hypothetical protein